ncbi:hypothetical protein ES703_66343 [subsurface metagenome]
MAIVEGGSGQTQTYTYCDEAGGTDSSFCTAYYSSLNNSTSCVAPGTAVRLTDPGHVISVAQWDEVDRVDAIRLQRIAPRQTATEARMAQEAALQRAQARIERNSVLLRQSMDRAAAQMSGLSRMEIGAQQEARTAAQQQAVLTQQDLERAVEQIQQRPRVSDRELGALWNEARGADPACDTYRYRIRLEEMGEFPVRSEPPPEPLYQAHWSAPQELQRPWDPQVPPRPVPQHPEHHPEDQPCTPTHSDNYLAQEKKREEAEERAQELLGHIIGKEQIEVYKQTNNLFVKGKKYSYIIPKDGFILQLKKDKVIELCVHLERRSAMPETDNVIAMKLRIENEEKNVLKLANKYSEYDREEYALPACAGMV